MATNNAESTVAGVATASGTLDLNAGRLGRLSAQVAQAEDGDARLGRLSAQVAQSVASDARLGRLSIQVALVDPGIITNECAGTPDGVASVTGTLTNIEPGLVEGITSGVASVVGALTIVSQLAGAPAGAATVEGALSNVIEVEATSAGQASVTGDLQLLVAPSATSNGVAVVSGALVQTMRLSGTSDGEAAIGYANLSNYEPTDFLFGRSDGTSTVAGALWQSNNAAGTTAGVATVTGDLWVFNQGELEGSSAGSSTVSGTLRGTAEIDRVSIQVAVQPDGGTVWVDRVSLAVARKIEPTIAGASAGTSTVSGAILVGAVLYGQSDGVAYVYGYIGNDRFLEGTSHGQATVTGALQPITSGRIPGPIPYPFPHLSPFVHEVLGIVLATSTVTGDLDQTHAGAGSLGGVATVSGTLTQIEPDPTPGPEALAGVSNGSATVTGAIGDTDFTNYLEGESNGVGACTHMLASDSLNVVRYLYCINNVGPGDSPTDDKSTIDGFVSQTFPDGTIDTKVRTLHLVNNVGPGYDPTDDKSDLAGFVSQVFPDGAWSNISRWLYLPQYVFALPDEPRRLTIGPTPKLPVSMLRGKPPVSQVGRGPEVV